AVAVVPERERRRRLAAAPEHGNAEAHERWEKQPPVGVGALDRDERRTPEDTQRSRSVQRRAAHPPPAVNEVAREVPDDCERPHAANLPRPRATSARRRR